MLTDVLIPMVVIIELMIAVPATEPVAWRKIDMNGYPVGDLRAASMSPRQKSIAISMPNPRSPLMRTLSIIEAGTAVDAFLISSDI
jgi:hypothetical protein